MNAQDLCDFVFARAVEETDSQGLLLGPDERRRLGRDARARGGDGEAFLRERSALLAREVEQRHPRLGRARRTGALLVPAPWILGIGAFVLGAAFDRLGGGRSVHVLAPPVLGLLVWNVGVYVLAALAARKRSAPHAEPSDSPRDGARIPLPVRVAAWLGERSLRATPGAGSAKGEGAVATLAAETRALARFARDWLAVSSPLQRSRTQGALHVAALGFALGVIASLYLRGLVLDYRATWESTFLGPDQARALLALALAPAALVTGIEIPDAEHLTRIRAQPEGAAPWIHLWAANLALIVVLPRALLAVLAARRARGLAAQLPFDFASDPYSLRLRAPDRGRDLAATVRPYSFNPAPRAREALVELLLELLGNRARVRFEEPLRYGDSIPPAGASGAQHVCRVLLFNLAQSPEQEVHGRLVEESRRWVEGGAGEASLLVCVDEGPYVERMGGDRAAEERVEERRRSWRRVLREAGLRAVFLRLDGYGGAAGLEAARGGLYPERTVGSLG